MLAGVTKRTLNTSLEFVEENKALHEKKAFGFKSNRQYSALDAGEICQDSEQIFKMEASSTFPIQSSSGFYDENNGC